MNFMKSHFKTLYEYTRSSNAATIGLVEKYGETIPQNVLVTFSHIINAHHIWNARILGEMELVKVWDVHSVEKLESLDVKNFNGSIAILDLIPIEKIILYKNSKGISYQNEVKDILFHVVNHSTYHRGQVMAQIRAAGLEPVSTDFIFYKR